MKLSVRQFKNLIQEVLWTASAPKRFNLPDIEVEADNTRDAADEAIKKWNVSGIDPFTIDVKPIVNKTFTQSNSDDDEPPCFYCDRRSCNGDNCRDLYTL